MKPENYVEPYAQPALNGRAGLTTIDIAKCLGAQHQHVMRSARTLAERCPELRLIRTEMRNDSGKGRKGFGYVVPPLAAKLIVAKYDNEIGLAYLRFLLGCEKVATEYTPWLEQRVKDLEALLAQATMPRLGKGKRGSRILVLEVEHDVLPGFTPVEKLRYVTAEQAASMPLERWAGRWVHLKCTKRGIDKALDSHESEMIN